MRKMVTFADAKAAREQCAPNLHELVAWLASPKKTPSDVSDTQWAPASLSHEKLGHAANEQLARRSTLARLNSSGDQLLERLELGSLILDLWRDKGPYARHQLIAIALSTPLTWGAWQGLKAVFKQAEQERDLELFGALAARFDAERAARRADCEVSIGTLTYLVRRAWRALRRTAMSFSACYPDAAVEVLRFYPEDCRFNRTIVAQSIFERDVHRRKNGPTRGQRTPSFQSPAFADLWRISPGPLLTLLERARSETVRRAAADFLMRDFRNSLSGIDPIQISRLVETGSPTAHRFCVWLLKGRLFEPAAFREIGLHDTALSLIDSSCPEARLFAGDYLRAHARNVHIQTVVKIARSADENLGAAAADILAERRFEDLSTETWAELASRKTTFELAKSALASAFETGRFDEAVVEKLLVSRDDRTAELGRSLLEAAKPEAVSASFLTKTALNPEVDAAVRAACLSGLVASTDALPGGKDWLGVIEELPEQLEDPLVGAVAEHASLGTFASSDAPRRGRIRDQEGIERLWPQGLHKGRRARIVRKFLIARLVSKKERLCPDERDAADDFLSFERLFDACEHWDPAIRRFALRFVRLFLETNWSVDVAVTLSESDHADVADFAHKDLAARAEKIERAERERVIRALGLSLSRAARSTAILLMTPPDEELSDTTLTTLMRSADSAVRRVAVDNAWQRLKKDDTRGAEVFFNLLKNYFDRAPSEDVEDGCHHLKGARAVTRMLDTLAELGEQNPSLARATLAFLRDKELPKMRAQALAHLATIGRLERAARQGKTMP